MTGLFVFAMRVTDMSLDTLRMLFVMRGRKLFAVQEHLPDGLDTSRLDFAVSTNEWHIEIESRRRNDPVGQFGH